MTVRQRSWSSAAADAASRKVAEAEAEAEAEAAAAAAGQSTSASIPLIPQDAAVLLHRIGTSASPHEDKVPRTGPKAIVMLQGKPLFFLILTWICFVLYILHVSEDTGAKAWGRRRRSNAC